MQVLDAGCGAGHYLPSLRDIVDPHIRYHGMDNTAYYVALARKAFNDASMFTQGDVLHMPFQDGAFDIVMCNNVVYHLPPVLEAPLRELVRVSNTYVLVRLIVADRNYVIREILTTEDGEGFDADVAYYPNLEDARFRYLNQYTAAYIRQAVEAVAPGARVTLTRDEDFGDFNNVDTHGMLTGTYTQGGKQVSGCLILDYHWLLIEKV
jgi:ubiquinone/menaquinone biosynthesis C-methylase UbiE